MAEFSLVAVLLMVLVLGVIQVAVYLWVRNVAAAAAAEGARSAAVAGASLESGPERAHQMIAESVGTSTAQRLTCVVAEAPGPDGVRVVEVSCSGTIPVFFAPVGEPLPITVYGRAIGEPR